MANRVHQWRDADVRRAVRLAYELGFAPATISIDTKSGVIKVTDLSSSKSIEVPRSPPVKKRESAASV
jgi:hypothetical protein